MNQRELLDAAKKKLRLETDDALARAMNVSHTAISNIRHGRQNLGPENALKLAEILHIDPARIAAAAYAARAKTREGRRRWEKAAVLGLLLALTHGAERINAPDLQSTHYAKYRKRYGKHRREPISRSDRRISL